MSATRSRFNGYVVIITGASRGIGIGIANSFAREGAKLVLVGRDKTSLERLQTILEGQGCEVLSLSNDISVEEDVYLVIKLTLEKFGRLDILCHNAGIYPQSRLEDMSLDQWKQVIDVNLTGTFLMIKACLPAMKVQGAGKIVITSSISGPKTGLPGFSHYTASKGGVSGFVKTAAVELAKYNITWSRGTSAPRL